MKKNVELQLFEPLTISGMITLEPIDYDAPLDDMNVFNLKAHEYLQVRHKVP